MKNIFLDITCLRGNKVYIVGECYHYLKNVRRVRKGSKVEAVIEGEKYSLLVSNIINRNIICDIETKRDIIEEKYINIHVYQGLLKSRKMDFVVSKLSELGVEEFFPVKTERAIPKIDIKKERIDRWKKLALEGAKVSGLERVMKINNPIKFSEVDRIFERKEKKIILLFSTKAHGFHIKRLLDSLDCSKGMIYHLFYGPEGGFSDDEVKKIMDYHGIPVTMGNFVLKSETASILGTGFIRLFCSER